jgi:hypothetical protein
MSDQQLYDQDFYTWANAQAGLLRARRLSEVDIDHIAEEIESMGKTEKRELINRLTVLFTHLLKWQFQPALRGKSWSATIRVQRNALARHLRDNPGLKGKLGEAIGEAYIDALIEAEGETDLPVAIFPASCPWSFEQIMNPEFWPDAAQGR